jgi:hypothetical protein
MVSPSLKEELIVADRRPVSPTLQRADFYRSEWTSAETWRNIRKRLTKPKEGNNRDHS